jgi:hypothetical protein
MVTWKNEKEMREDNIKLDLREIGSKDGRRMKLAKYHVQWRTLVLMCWNLWSYYQRAIWRVSRSELYSICIKHTDFDIVINISLYNQKGCPRNWDRRAPWLIYARSTTHGVLYLEVKTLLRGRISAGRSEEKPEIRTEILIKFYHIK